MKRMLMYIIILIISSYNVVFSCQDECMSYGMTVLSVYPYNRSNFFYVPLETTSGCKQCYFSVNSSVSNIYNVGLFNYKDNSMTYASSSDLSGNIGFTTCNIGYCMIIFKATGFFSSFSVQVIDTPNSNSGCIYNNSHCNNEGIIAAQIVYSTSYPSYYKLIGCVF
jgi:hypothetical protein